MQIDTLTLGPFETNSFIIRNNAGEALLVDPANEPQRILDTVAHRHLTVEAILVTHGHMDHVSGLAHIAAQLQAPIAMHPVDARWAFTPMNAMPPYYDTPEQPETIARPLAEGQSWQDIGARYDVWELPGHSPGHVAFYFPDEACIFSGDVLFRGSVGRIDLPGGDGAALQRSLQRISTLPDETRVFCGHGPDTTIGAERRTNPFLRELRG
jgi:hydroxyacylglutathione hydrolase